MIVRMIAVAVSTILLLTNVAVASNSSVVIGDKKFYLNDCTLTTDEYGRTGWLGSYAPAGWKGYPYITIFFPADKFNDCKQG